MLKKLFSLFTTVIVVCFLCFSTLPKSASSQSVTGYWAPYSYTNVGKKASFKNTLEAYLKEYADACWFCKVFVGDTSKADGIYASINDLTKTIFNEMAGDFLALMGVGILFLLIFKVGKMLVQLQEVDVMQFLNDLFKPLGRAIIATALLSASVAVGSQTIFYLLTNPVLDVSLRIGEKVLETSLGEVKTIAKKTFDDVNVSSVSSLADQITSVNWSPINTAASKENAQKGGDKPLGESQRLIMLQWMKSVSSSFIVGIALGGSFVKVGLDNFFKSGGLSMTLAGAIIWTGFWVVYLMFPFKLIDAFVRVAFVLALMPLWIILWVFPATQQYTKKAWEMFLSACLLFTVLSIMVAISLMLINRVVPEKLYSDTDNITRSEFFELLLAGKNDKAVKYAGFGSGLCMNALAFTAMSFSLLSAAATIANSFIGGGGNIQTNVGAGMAATTAQAGRVAWSATKATAKAGMWAGGKIHSKLSQFRGGPAAGGSAGNVVGGPTDGNGGGSGGGNNGSGGGEPGGSNNAQPIVVQRPRDERNGRTDQSPRGNDGDNGLHGNNGGNGSDGADGRRGGRGPGGAGGSGLDRTILGSSFERLTPVVQAEIRRQAANRENGLADTQNDLAARRRMMASTGTHEREALVQMAETMRRGGNLTPDRTALHEAIARDRAEAQSSFALLSSTAQSEVRQLTHTQEERLLNSLNDPVAKRDMLASAGTHEREAMIQMAETMQQGGNLEADRANLQEAIAHDRAATEFSAVQSMTPEREHAVQELVAEPDTVAKLQDTIPDVRFIENSLSMKEDDFKRAMETHTWQSADSEGMKAFAERAFTAQDKPLLMEQATKQLLHPMMESTNGWRTANQIADKVGHSVQAGDQSAVLSSQLDVLMTQISTKRGNHT